MKPQYYFYMVRFPGDSDENLDWSRIFPTRNQANTFAREVAAGGHGGGRYAAWSIIKKCSRNNQN